MKNGFYILILLLILQSCLNMTEPEHQAQYIESFKSFDKEMVSHFPKKIPNNWIHLSQGSPKYINEYSSNAELSLEIRITSKKKFEELKKELIAIAKIVKISSDSCLLVVDSDEKQNLSNYDNYCPVPQETIYDFESDKWIRQENCEVAFIDYKSGKFVESKYLTVKEYLPENWRNGYSKGYSFDNSKQTIMYWLIIW